MGAAATCWRWRFCSMAGQITQIHSATIGMIHQMPRVPMITNGRMIHHCANHGRAIGRCCS